MIGELIEFGEQVGLTRWTAQNYLDELNLEASEMHCILSEDGGVIAFIVGRMVPGDVENEWSAEIYNFAVRSELTGSGLAKRLIEHFIDRVVQRTARSIWLEVRESNVRAIAFYRKFNFTEISRRPAYYSDPREAAVVMLLELPEIES